jgi:Methyltransferase domain
MSRLSQRVRLSASILLNQRRGIAQARRFTAPTQVPAERGHGELERYFDEHRDGPGIWKWRHYFGVYERHLERFRGRAVHVVEIGVYAGGSIDMWRWYFGPQSRIFGVDIDPSCRVHQRENAEIFIGDQSDRAFWEGFLTQVPEIDVVLDDGGHEFDQQVASLEALLPRMRPGGVYICEDVVGVANPLHDYVAGLVRNLHSDRPYEQRADGEARVKPTPFQRSIGSVHVHPFAIVIEKRAHPPQLELLRHGTQWPD